MGWKDAGKEQTEDKGYSMAKCDALVETIRQTGSMAVAFSGGVDSTFLLKVAHDVLGDQCIALTAVSPAFPERERQEAADFCRKEGIRQLLFETEELEHEEYRQNPPNRCYLCKHILFSQMQRMTKEEGIAVLAEGTNMDDGGDYRPGMAAIAELGVFSPLRETGWTKAEIRACSRHLGLPTWDKSAFACLATRFVYGERITREKLDMVGKGEALLASLGLKQYRVRIHGTMARIEVLPQDFPVLMEEGNRKRIAGEFRSYGFSYVSLDMEGYRMGAMNEVLKAGS